MQVGSASLQGKEVELPSVATGTLTKGLVSLFPHRGPTRKAMLGTITQHFKYSAKAKCNCGKAGGVSALSFLIVTWICFFKSVAYIFIRKGI